MILKKIFLSFCGIYTLLCLCITPASAGDFGHQGTNGKPVAKPAWHNRPISLSQAVSQADVIVRAKVIQSNSGPKIAGTNIPTQLVSFKVS